MDDRKAMYGIFYVLRTGCQWKALPHSLGRKSTVHDRFQEWRKAGVFEGMWRESLLEYDATKGIVGMAGMDAAMTKAPLRGEKARGRTPR
jgi:putative transposase